MLILTDIAISFDDQLAEAYSIKGSYYYAIGNQEQAIKECDKAIKFNPNDGMAYGIKGNLYSWGDDLVKAIDNFQKAASLNRGKELPSTLKSLSSTYYHAGFIEKSKYYRDEALKLDGDSVGYYIFLAGLEQNLEDFAKANDFLWKAYSIDSMSTYFSLASNYNSLRQYDESLRFYKKWIERKKATGSLALWDMQRVGYAYWQNGYKKEAEYYFDKHIEYCNNEIKLGRFRSKQLFSYYDLAGIYAFRGEKDKAYENLRIYNQRKREPFWMVVLIKNDPLFDSIRDEPEFQQIVRDVEAKYQAEHERVRKWLEEQEME
ncbi:MAG: tetratricopeptide repeat protein [Bacteroidales bacterium]|nr:tetratricopeptide repeat protein [Bacteroidales bacterium]